MTPKEVLALLRKYGTEVTIKAMLSPERGTEAEVLARLTALTAALISVLEKKKVLRRGNILEAICRMEAIDTGDRDEVANE